MRIALPLLRRVDAMADRAKYRTSRSWLIAKYIEDGLARDGDKVVEPTGVFE
jgi:hypothetical protein